MESVIISSEEEIIAEIEKHNERGLRLAAISNAGLPEGQWRFTFIPEDAFRDKCLNDGLSVIAFLP